MTGRTVVFAAATLAGALLVVARVSSSLDLGFDPDRVGNAGEWFAGIAGAAVLAWSIGEPARKERERRVLAQLRVDRMHAWDELYWRLAPFEDPHPLAKQISEWAKDAPDTDPYHLERRRASPYQLVRSRVEIPSRLITETPKVVDTLETLAVDLDVDRLVDCVRTLRRLHRWTCSQTWLPADFGELTTNWATIRDQPTCKVTAAANDVLVALRDLSFRNRHQPTGPDVDLAVRWSSFRDSVPVSVPFKLLSDALEQAGG